MPYAPTGPRLAGSGSAWGASTTLGATTVTDAAGGPNIGCATTCSTPASLSVTRPEKDSASSELSDADVGTRYGSGPEAAAFRQRTPEIPTTAPIARTATRTDFP